ncbi:hypothetical protein [Solimonas sp. K1W22B-7]|uniref:hypothetical protein n=1 Tax=Solimonas sp. K1W22B-7 TaxID=2303331 RepID=UPI0013C51CC0|nr:hypothetical protein [Solimonas sp. K1W22B-7]
MKTFTTTMLLATALLMAPAAQAAPGKAHKARAARASVVRHIVYSPAGGRLQPPAPRPAIAGLAPQPPAPPAAEPGQITALMNQCQAAMPAAHPYRAAQASREMFQLELAMSYRAAAAQLSPQEVAGAMAIEARAYGNLAATCAPLLV